MSRPLPALRHVFPADRLARDGSGAPPGLSLGWLAGRLVEIAGGPGAARLTAAVGLVREAQEAGEPAVWIAVGESRFHPPDVARGGVDLHALPVVLAPDVPAGMEAAVRLARSGAFGLLVLDLVDASGPAGPSVPVGGLTRLVGLAQAHDLAVVFLTDKAAGQPSIHSLVAVRGQAARGGGPGGWTLRFEATKDKRSGPGWTATRPVLPPEGVP